MCDVDDSEGQVGASEDFKNLNFHVQEHVRGF